MKHTISQVYLSSIPLYVSALDAEIRTVEAKSVWLDLTLCEVNDVLNVRITQSVEGAHLSKISLISIDPPDGKILFTVLTTTYHNLCIFFLQIRRKLGSLGGC